MLFTLGFDLVLDTTELGSFTEMKFLGGFHSGANLFFQLSVLFLLSCGLPLPLGRAVYFVQDQNCLQIKGCVENSVK